MMSLERVLYPAYGRVARRADQMSSVGDLAKFNTDKLTKTEKEAKDYEYTEGSRLAKAKLEKQKMARPSHHQCWEPKDLNRRLNKATDAQKKKYLKDGEIPPA